MRLDEVALARWVQSLNRRGELEDADEAIHPDIVFFRYGSGSCADQVVEERRGTEAVVSWIRSQPPGAIFMIDGEFIRADGIFREVDHAVEVPFRLLIGALVVTGVWRYELAPDGRIVHMEHHPRDLLDGVDTLDAGAADDALLAPSALSY